MNDGVFSSPLTTKRSMVSSDANPGVGRPMDARRWRAKSPLLLINGFTFTFTFNRHLGKTHNHRSRGDTPWRARSYKRFW